MYEAHIHLLINHLPIFGSILGAFVLIHGLWTKSNSTKSASYNIFIISSIGAGIAYATGEGAEESVENIQSVLDSTIEQHEEFALFALIALIILGVVSILGLFFTIKKLPLANAFSIFILFISLISFGLVARTGFLGGQIRHTELNSTNDNFKPTENVSENEIEED